MQSITITNQAGQKLAANLFWPDPEPNLILVVCHGFRGAKENGGRIYNFAHRVNELGIGLLAFDFNGSGQSEGDFCKMTLTRQAADLQSVLDFAAENYNLPVVLLGRSFGGSTAIVGGTGDDRVMAYILWSTPIFITDTFQKMLPEKSKNLTAGQLIHIQDDAGEYDLEAGFLLDLDQYNMDQYLQLIHNKPVLIIHAQDDELVPVPNAVYLHSKLGNSQLHLIDNAGHRFLEKTELREDITLEWLQGIRDCLSNF